MWYRAVFLKVVSLLCSIQAVEDFRYELPTIQFKMANFVFFKYFLWLWWLESFQTSIVKDQVNIRCSTLIPYLKKLNMGNDIEKCLVCTVHMWNDDWAGILLN